MVVCLNDKASAVEADRGMIINWIAVGDYMPCYAPLQAFRSDEFHASGKRVIKFSTPQAKLFQAGGDALSDREYFFNLPCGRCVGCRLERSRQWALRCVHEASLYDKNCFITLTYAPEHLPSDNSLHVEHFQLFMKRLRKAFGDGIRFFHCGEYGEKHKRPHYHACIFNFDFDDRLLFSQRGGVRLYTSKALSRLWPFGFCTVGDVTFESAAYVARYIMKKVTGDDAPEHYAGRKPEYVTMSRRPGIGARWFEKYSKDVYPSDECPALGDRGVCKPPRFYDSLYEIDNPLEMEFIREKRMLSSLDNFDDSSYDRLKVKEKCKLTQISRLARTVDQEL